MQDLHPVLAGGPIAIQAGDLLYLDVAAKYAKTASAFPGTVNLATTQADFAAVFLGVAQQPVPAGDVAVIMVDMSPFSVYQYQCPVGVYQVGQMFACNLNPSGPSLWSQQIMQVPGSYRAFARAWDTQGMYTNNARIQIASAFACSSSNGLSDVGESAGF